MTRFYQKITGLANVSGPSVGLLPEDEALGYIPDWALFLDPDYLVGTGAGGGLYNRVDNARLTNRASETGAAAAVPVGVLPGSGLPAFAPSSSAVMSITSPVPINRDRWTFFTVGQYETSGNSQHLAVSMEANVAADPGINPRVGATPSANELVVWTYGAYGDQSERRRIGSGALLLTSRVSLLLWSFSIERGLTLRANGAEVKRAANDRRPLTAGYLANQWRLFAFMRGKFGMTGLINRDLTSPENAAHLASLEGFMMQRYSLT